VINGQRRRAWRWLRGALAVVAFGSPALALPAERITVAAAADLKFAMDEIVSAYVRTHSDASVDVVYGSSGKFATQIRQGAPYDLYFSADIAYPCALADAGFAASPVKPYALGRIVLWSAGMDASTMTLHSLVDPRIRRIAIANPTHAPYGKRAEEALRAAGIWTRVQHKLVYGDNIAHTAQFVQSGNAQIGIIALSLALNPQLAAHGGYGLIPAALHEPLQQGYMVTARAADNPLARAFADYIDSAPARAALARYGFVLPRPATGPGQRSTSAACAP